MKVVVYVSAGCLWIKECLWQGYVRSGGRSCPSLRVVRGGQGRGFLIQGQVFLIFRGS